MTETGKVLWITALLWLSTADLLYMKLPYPALFLFALSGILKAMPGFLNALAQPDGMIIMTILHLLIIGAFSIYVCRKKQMGKGDLIVLMIMGAVYPTDQLLLILSLGLQLHQVFIRKLLMFTARTSVMLSSGRSSSSFSLRVTELLKTSLDSSSTFSHP